MNKKLVLLLLLNLLIQSTESEYTGDEFLKWPISQLKKMYHGYKIKRISDTAILGKKRKNHQDKICINKVDSKEIKYEASQIKVYTGGRNGFAWKIKNTLHVYDVNHSQPYAFKLPEFIDIYDVILAPNKAYLYCCNEQQEILCILALNALKAEKHIFKPKKQCLILEDQYCRYVTTCDQYSLIEGLPQYSPSLLVSNFPVRQTIGIFKYQFSDKHIAMSHDLRQYVVHNKGRFLHYNYQSMKNTLYDIEKEKFIELELDKILFAATDDVLILQGKKKLLLISFEEKKHWVASNGKSIIKVFPHVESGKTIIQTTHGNFGCLEYTNETNEFNIVPL